MTPMPESGPARVRIAVLIGFALALGVALTGPLDRLSEASLDAGLKRALATFALARGLNAAISVAQGTEIAVQPAGVGLVLTPGQVLDPVNDLIERFSWVMLVAAASLGVQKLLLALGSQWLFTALLASLWVALALLYWRQGPTPLSSRLAKLLAALLLLRFAVPLVALLNQGLHDVMLEQEYRQAGAGLETTTSRIGQLQAEDAPLDENADGLIEGARRWYQSAMSGLDIGARLRAYEVAAAAAVESAVRLIALFVLQTLILPLIFLWLLWRLGRWLVISL